MQFIQRALELDPRNFYTLQQISLSYANLRRYAEEAAVLDRAIAIKPDDVETRVTRALVALDWKADTRPACIAIIDEIRVKNPAALQDVADVWVLLRIWPNVMLLLCSNALGRWATTTWGDNATLFECFTRLKDCSLAC